MITAGIDCASEESSETQTGREGSVYIREGSVREREYLGLPCSGFVVNKFYYAFSLQFHFPPLVSLPTVAYLPTVF